MSWILKQDDGTESEPFESKRLAEYEKQSLEQLGASVELCEVERDGRPIDGDAEDLDVEIIETSVQNGGNGGNNATDDDDIDSLPEPRDELSRYAGQMSLCPTCERWSRAIYRCQIDNCGRDLTDEPNYRGDQL